MRKREKVTRGAPIHAWRGSTGARGRTRSWAMPIHAWRGSTGVPTGCS